MEIGYIKKQPITEEMKESYLDYAMSVIISRALPDVRDGLKPVHRRILYVMWEDGLRPSAKFRKSATVVGSCLGRYHPHGDLAVYDAMVRMAQDFQMRYPLVDGQGNFGCFTKETKIRLTDGRSVSFEQLIREAKEGRKNWTFSFNAESKEIEIAEIRNPRLTRRKEKIVEITLDNGENIRCTLDHLFMLRDGSYKKAKDLKPNDSLMPFYTEIYQGQDANLRGYEIVHQPFKNAWDFVHHLADKWNLGQRVYKKSNGKIRHHLDFNKLNNNPDNILRIQWADHWRHHKKIASRRHKNDPEYIRKIAEGRKKFWAKKENRLLASLRLAERNKVMWQNPKYRKRWIRAKKKMWQNPEYKEFMSKAVSQNLKKLWKSKILGFVYSLSKNYSEITPEVYEKERYNNCFPRIENILNYFNNFSELVKEAKRYNHKVAKRRILRNRKDVYDLTVEPWHNFLLGAEVFVHNSLDNDPPAASRYTEAKMTEIAEEMLFDIEKETVDWIDNYDATRKEPTVLPAKLPNLLLNGSMGIAVGMATNIPPHNLTEIVDGIVYLIDHPQTITEELCRFIKGPDFPTGGLIYDKKGIIQAYSTGRGPIVSRAKTEIVEKKPGQFQILVTEMTYGVNKANLIEKIANFIKEKRIEGIRDIRDESDKEGIRLVIDLKNDVMPQKILNRLFKLTDLQKTFYLNMLALVDGIQPQVLSLKKVLEYYIEHRQQVVTRRTQFELKQAQARAHILAGLKKALDQIDAVIKTIKQSATRETAHQNLVKKFKLTAAQATAILEMRLQTLAGLEQKKIIDELKEKKKLIQELTLLLKSPKRILSRIKKELEEIKKKYADQRRTKVYSSPIGQFKEEELVPEEESIIILTRGGYIKRVNPRTYRAQKRGGKGILGITPRAEDVVEHFLAASTHDNILFFTGQGRVFQTKAYEIAEASRLARGQAIVNVLQLKSDERVTALVVLPVQPTGYLLMTTKNGIIKKTSVDEFVHVRRSGLMVITLDQADQLEWAEATSGRDEVILVTAQGQSIRFQEKDVRPMGRTAGGVRGIRLRKGDQVVGMDIINSKLKSQSSKLLIVTENGFGKKTDLQYYKIQKRGGLGIKAARLTDKTGLIVAGTVLGPDKEDLIAISQKGQVIRTKLKDISTLGRTTQGVKIMKMGKGDKVASVTCL